VATHEIRFDGRAILITGAGRGIGRSHALLLASRGAKVVVADYGAATDGADPSSAPAAAVVAEIRAAGGEAAACAADIGTEEGSHAAVDACMSAFGRIDGILHNASTMPYNTPAAEISTRDLDLVMRVNAYAAIWMSRRAWPAMQAQGYGRILFMTSAGIYGSTGNAPYSAAKAAVIGAMRCFAPEGAPHGIRVNVVAPAALTRMTEALPANAYAAWFRRTMLPERVSPGVAWLMSEACDINGEMFHVGGGRIARLRLGEGHGVRLAEDTIEAAAEAFPEAMAQADLFYPKDLIERSLVVARGLGFDGDMAADAFTAAPREQELR
jgi:NAD(P)-dependent dehydrogenase (short-subunit alcohol dehydrogenase family)